MGGCAGCMGPNRRESNYRVNKLTEHSPIKSRLSMSELPINRNRDRINEDGNQSKKKLGPNNLIATLINSRNDINASPQVNYNAKSNTNYYYSPDSNNQVYVKDSYLLDSKQRRGSILFTKKPQINTYFNQNNLDTKMMPDMPRPFSLQLTSSSFKKNQTAKLYQSGKANDNIIWPSQIYNSSIIDSRLGNKKASQLSKFSKKGLINIPQLSDEESKTPQYVKQIRKKNGEDIRMTDLQNIPRKIESIKPLNLFKYLKDLK